MRASPERLLMHRIQQRRRRQVRGMLYDPDKHPSKRGNSRRAIMEAWLGCTAEQFRVYIQNQFKDGMTWDNASKWDIDHVIPLFHSNAGDNDQMRKLWHYTNLRPLWAKENRSRPKRIERIAHQPGLLL